MKPLTVLLLSACSGVLIGCHPSGAAEETPDIHELVARMDKLYRAETSYAEVEMDIVTPNWERTLRMRMWTQGMDRTFITITSPKKDAGIATLRKGTEMWNYFPKINKVMKVPPSMMMGSWMGSDFTNDDLVKESSYTEDYDPALGEPERDDVYEIVLTPGMETATVWGKIVFTVRKADLMPIRQDFYDEKGHRMREMVFREVRAFGGRTLPAVMEMTPLNKEGHRTVIRYIDARFDQRLEKGVFTRRNLQKRR